MLSAADSSTQVVIEIVSDVVCPWCFIGKRRLEKALRSLNRTDVRVRWRPFELNPGIAKEGVDRTQHRIRKFGSLERARQLEAQVAAAGAGEGIEFHFDRIKTTPNTFDAHRLVWLADQGGLQDGLVERLFHAYFIAGEDVGNREVLRRIAGESGLDASAVRQVLEGGLGTEEVSTYERETRAMGVSGVPTFFVDGTPVTSGAHPAPILASMLGQALPPAPQCSTESGTCAP
jgi:predicted DsbA family dithiol-disulfide isomerase